jgi:hypothetical protein
MDKFSHLSRLACFAAVLAAAPLLKAGNIILFQDFGGASALTTAPLGYGLIGCNTTSCVAAGSTPYDVESDTTPTTTVYIGDAAGFVSDEIWGSVTPTTDNQGDPGFTFVVFNMDYGLDRGGSPFTCASVGGCALTANGALDNLGVITWENGFFPVPVGYETTTLEFQYIAPEPGTFFLLGGALLGLAGLRRRGTK